MHKLKKLNMWYVSVLLLVIISVASRVDGEAICEVDNSAGLPVCMCKFNNGSKIDLRNITKEGGPRFSNISQTEDPNITYYYNPCYRFNINSGCNNALLCEKHLNAKNATSLDTQDTVFDNTESGKIYINYVGYEIVDGVNTTIRSKVQLICNNDTTSPEFSYLREDNGEEDIKYYFNLTSKCCCAGGCNVSAPPANHGGNSSEQSKDPGIVGITLLSVLVAVVLGYFIIGSIIMKVKYQATGSDIIPNKLFWMSLPFLVKDGVLFIVSPCVKVCDTKGYTKVDD